MAAHDIGELFLGGRARGADGREDPAAGGVQLLVGRARGAEGELLDAVAREAGVRVAVDEPGDRAQAAAVELLDLALERSEVAHRPDPGDVALLTEDIGVDNHLDLPERAAAQRCIDARRRDELGEIADEQPPHGGGVAPVRTPSGAGPSPPFGKRAYASAGTGVSSSTPAPCFCASSETG